MTDIAYPFSLTYLSSAMVHWTQEALEDLLRVSRRNNARDEITGMLLYKEAVFLQVLEGSEAAVRGVYAIIERDSRHRHLIVLSLEHAKQRRFSHWSMGFCNLGTDSVKPAGYNEFLNSPLTGAEFSGRPERAEKLLLLFKERM